MVEITEKVHLSYKDAKDVPIPRNLLHVADAGERYLKIQGSHPVICKLASGGCIDLFKQCKNCSLSSSTKYGSLKEKLANAVEAACKKEEEGESKAMFEATSTQSNQKKKKASLQTCPDTLEIDVNTCKVVVLCPMSWKQQDLWVLLEASMLEAVFDFLAEDVEACLKNESKRSYSKRKLQED